MATVRIRKLAMIAAASAAITTIAMPRMAHAETEYYFVSPSGNIGCMMGSLLNGGVMCDIKHYTYARPPDPDHCTGHVNWGDRFSLNPGQAPAMPCHGDTVFDPELDRPPNYGEQQSFGPITCESEQTGITCTDTGTGHYFRVSIDSYQLG